VAGGSFLRGSASTATFSLIVAFGLLAAGTVYSRRGPTTIETGIVTRFGMPDAHAFVLVRMPDGREQAITTTAGSLRACAIGRPIRLMRQGRVLSLAPFACQP